MVTACLHLIMYVVLYVLSNKSQTPINKQEKEHLIYFLLYMFTERRPNLNIILKYLLNPGPTSGVPSDTVRAG